MTLIPPTTGRHRVPDASTVVLVLAGFETPDTTLLVLLHDMLEWWRRHFAAMNPGADADRTEKDLIAFGAYLVDREIASVLGESPGSGGPCPSPSYGQVAARLVQGFVLFEMSRDAHWADFDPARLGADINALDTLTADIRNGRA